MSKRDKIFLWAAGAAFLLFCLSGPCNETYKAPNPLDAWSEDDFQQPYPY